MRGVTLFRIKVDAGASKFQPALPMRGVTRKSTLAGC